MTREEFYRPFTEAELRTRFEKEGFDESLWEFCLQINHLAYDELRDSQLDLEEGETIEEHIAYLKEEECWTAETIREEAWNYGMKETYVNAYLSQRSGGHGHNWSFIYAEQVRDESTNPTVDAYNTIKSKNKSEANRECEIFIDSLPESKNPIFNKALAQSFGQGQTIEEDIGFARGVAYQYDQLLKIGCKSDELYNYAQDLAKDRNGIYYQAYKIAINNEASSFVAYSFADKIEELHVNGYLLLDTRSFCNEFKEIWQREFYYALVMEDVAHKNEHWSVFDKNRLRAMLGLPSIDEPLTIEDKEYLRIQQDLMANGMNEITADRKIHKAVYEREESSLKLRPISESERIKQDMGHMMYPNEEDYQDYLDGEI